MLSLSGKGFSLQYEPVSLCSACLHLWYRPVSWWCVPRSVALACLCGMRLLFVVHARYFRIGGLAPDFGSLECIGLSVQVGLGQLCHP